MNYNLEITKVTVDNQDNKKIISVFWNLSFYDENGFIGQEFGESSLENIIAETFVPYHQITKEQLNSWVLAKLNLDDFYKAAVLRKQQEQKNNNSQEIPTNELTPPWQGGLPITHSKKTRRQIARQ